MTVIEAINIFFNIVSNYRCIKVFKLLVYLGAGAYIVILLKDLYTCKLLLLGVLFYFIVMAFYRASIGFPFRLL